MSFESVLGTTQAGAETALKSAGGLTRELRKAKAAAAVGQVRELRRALDAAARLAAELSAEVQQVQGGVRRRFEAAYLSSR